MVRFPIQAWQGRFSPPVGRCLNIVQPRAAGHRQICPMKGCCPLLNKNLCRIPKLILRLYFLNPRQFRISDDSSTYSNLIYSLNNDAEEVVFSSDVAESCVHACHIDTMSHNDVSVENKQYPDQISAPVWQLRGVTKGLEIHFHKSKAQQHQKCQAACNNATCNITIEGRRQKMPMVNVRKV